MVMGIQNSNNHKSVRLMFLSLMLSIQVSNGSCVLVLVIDLYNYWMYTQLQDLEIDECRGYFVCANQGLIFYINQEIHFFL